MIISIALSFSGTTLTILMIDTIRHCSYWQAHFCDSDDNVPKNVCIQKKKPRRIYGKFNVPVRLCPIYMNFISKILDASFFLINSM